MNKEEVNKINREDREIDLKLQGRKTGLGSAEASLTNAHKTKLWLEKEFKLKMNEQEKRIQRAVHNIEQIHSEIASLLQIKEDLHDALLAAVHDNEVQCEYCTKYFKTNAILKRHQLTCEFKPEKKISKKSKDKLKKEKDHIAKRKSDLLKEIEELGK